MSELARNEYGDEWTAYDLKDETLKHGTKFEWFVCAFCDIPVTPAAIDKPTYVKGPYFTLAKKDKPHEVDCPYGEKTFADYGVVRPKTAKHKYAVDLPERLIPVRSRNVSSTTHVKPATPASLEEIRSRVCAKAAAASIANQYTTSLLAIVAGARKEAIDSIKNDAAIKKIKDSAVRWKKIYSELRNFPLDVYGRKLNYGSAFHRTNHEHWAGTFIYYGAASVERITNGFRLTSDNLIPSEKADGTKISIPAHVLVMCNEAAPRDLMEKKTIEILGDAISKCEPVSWYAYGEFVMNDSESVYQLTVLEPPHIYCYITK